MSEDFLWIWDAIYSKLCDLTITLKLTYLLQGPPTKNLSFQTQTLNSDGQVTLFEKYSNLLRNYNFVNKVIYLI